MSSTSRPLERPCAAHDFAVLEVPVGDTAGLPTTNAAQRNLPCMDSSRDEIARGGVSRPALAGVPMPVGTRSDVSLGAPPPFVPIRTIATSATLAGLGILAARPYPEPERARRDRT